jgi:hypothetical protein
MANLTEDIASFLDDLAGDLTRLHVTAAQYQNAPTDPDAVEALAKLPAGLLDRAQALRARLDDEGDEPEREPKAAKPKAKAAAKR